MNILINIYNQKQKERYRNDDFIKAKEIKYITESKGNKILFQRNNYIIKAKEIKSILFTERSVLQ